MATATVTKAPDLVYLIPGHMQEAVNELLRNVKSRIELINLHMTRDEAQYLLDWIDERIIGEDGPVTSALRAALAE
jgi:hypothetical protein